MKLVSLFADFLRDTVNLNQTRIDTLETSVDALKAFLRDADWGASIRTFEEQGSWAHDTIIRPVDGGEFDADLLVMVNPVKGWSAADYVQKLGAAFAGSKNYEDTLLPATNLFHGISNSSQSNCSEIRAAVLSC